MSRRCTSLVLVLLVFAAAFLPMAAQAEKELPSQLRQRLIPVYEQMMVDPEIQKLRKDLDRDPSNIDTIERYLRKMPMSPMAAYQLDMFLNRWESIIPLFIYRWHEAWVMLNQDLARDHYGDERVHSILFEQPIPVTRDQSSLREGVLTTLAASVGTNRNTASGGSPSPQSYQGEIQLVVNPNNTNQMVSAANTWDTMGGACGGGIQAVFYSSDGGQTWGYTCPPDDSGYAGMSCAGSVFGSDPALSWNDNNEVFINYMLLCSSGGSTLYSMVVARSADGGATWSGQGIIRNSWGTGTLEDKNFYVVDNNSGSPYYGRHYTCWDRSNNEKFAYSTNNGQTWTEVDLPAGGGLDLGCDLAVEDDGTIHIVFDTLTCSGQNCQNEEMFYTRSTNGGLSWSSTTLVRDFNLVAFSTDANPDAQDERGVGPFGAVDVDNSGGACDGNIYATFTDKTSSANDSDIFISRSTNGGSSWSAPIRVNDDGLANRIQFHPTLLVDQSSGAVVVAWHDARNDAGNDAIDIFVGRSTDCGSTWENVQASQPSSEFNNSSISYTNLNTSDNPNANPNQAGEYMGLDVIDGKVYLAWTDTRHYFPDSTSESEDENLGFAIIDFGSGGGNQSPSVSISSPASGSTFDVGTSASFSGTATDAEDGTISSSLSWSSSLDASIGSGASFSTSGLSLGSHTITASVTDSASASGSDSITVTINDPNNNGPQDAVYNSGLGAPACAIAGSSCDSTTLLDGRGAGLGPEPNQPNTLDSCSDGTLGSYHGDESNDSIVVSTLDGSDMSEGATVTIDATVWAWSDGSSDTLDLYYAANANSPSWVFVSSLSTPTGGAQTLSANYTLPAGSLQAVRAIFRYNGSASSCSGGDYDDNDDLVFAVGGGNQAPTVNISAPANGSSFSEGQSISFSGTATDPEDGNLASGLSWTSSIDGAIGTGASFSTSGLSAGSHSISASVSDSGGASDSDSISLTVTVVNTAPSVTISSPSNGSSFSEGQPVSFTGSASDAQDGSLTSSLSWSSDLDGSIGSGGSFSSSSLSAGNHTITASVTDSGGLGGSDSVDITITVIVNTIPTVAITAPADASSSTDGDMVFFSGTATDSQDGDLGASLSWTSSLDGTIGSGTAFSINTLSVGNHTITASVTDSGGLSDSDNITLTVASIGGGVFLDFSTLGMTSYSNQDQTASGTVAVEGGGSTYYLEGNRWRRSTTTFNITAATVVRFDFWSDSEGEIHGIGFDEDDGLSSNRIFKLYGTQSWGIATYDDYASSGTWKSYCIPVGSSYTSSAMSLVLVNDKDSGTANNTSRFRNVEINETSCGGGPAALDLSSYTWTGYGSQDTSGGAVAIEDAGATYYLEGNRWRRTQETFNITANTVVEFEFWSSSEGEIHGIGFDENDGLSSSRIFKLHGTQNWGITTFDNYPGTSSWVTYTIPVGQSYTGSAMFLVFVNDKDSGTGNNTGRFRNVKVYEP